MADQKKRLIIIDSNSLIHRAYHALPPLTTKKGELVNAIYGFLLVFLKVLREMKPDFVAAAFDLPGPTFRHKEFKKYKAKRVKAPEELYQQISKIKEVLRAFKVPIFEKQGFEADDLIGTIAKLAPRKQAYPELETIILSGDLDSLQLINQQTKVYTLKKGIKDTILYDIEKVRERYQGLDPSQLTDFKSLRGDPSDNIPGVTGIGEKTAIKLIKEFGSLENLYQEIDEKTEKAEGIKDSVLKKLKDYKEQAFISKRLVQIKEDVPIDFNLKEAKFEKINKEKITEVFKSFEFYTLLKRLEELTSYVSLKQQGLMSFPDAKRSIEEEIENLAKEGIISEKIAKIEKALVKVVKEMGKNGIKIDLRALREVSENLEIKIKDLQAKIFNLALGEFNLNSPQQVREVLFEKLKIEEKGLKRTPAGVVSTGAQELQKLREAHPIIDLISKHRELFKLKSGFVDALPKMIDKKDGRIHPHFHQLGTVSGRMSCSTPNLQNIPIKSETGKEIRKCFCSAEGFKFLSADYSQMELRIAAAISQDKRIQELFQKGEDIHRLTAAQIFQIPEKEITETQRNFAKTLSFGILYGMGARGLAARTDFSLREAKEFIDKYFEKFPEFTKFIKKSIERAREKGFVETLSGRKRFLPELNSIDPRLRSRAERMARNFPIQGLAADICKMAMVKIEEEGLLNKDCKMILQIHDELLFEIKGELVKETAFKIKEIMERIYQLTPPPKVELRIGGNWKEMDFLLK